MESSINRVIGGNAKVVRSINRATILNIIREQQPISRSEISNLMGLNKSTISRIVHDLLKENFIDEKIYFDENVGRNPLQLRLKKAVHYVGAINIDSETTWVAVFDIDGSIVKVVQLKTEINNADDYFERCAKKLKELQKDLKISKLEGIGVNLAGIVDSDSENIVNAINLGIKNVHIGGIFKKYFSDVSNIKFENSANSSALAELWFKNGKSINIDNFVFLWIGIGIGAGIIVDKKLLKGNCYSAGEFGRMTMFGSGDPEIYTESENLEAYASNRATIKRYNMLQNKTNNDKMESKIKKIIQKAKENDANAIKALKETGSYLGIGVSNIIKSIDPQAIIVGGEIVAVWDIIYPEIMKIVEKHVDQFMDHKVSIFPTFNKANSALIGAATLPIMEIFRNYSITR
jgi:predicted NBD/HSP70 family sugar kinase